MTAVVLRCAACRVLYNVADREHGCRGPKTDSCLLVRSSYAHAHAEKITLSLSLSPAITCLRALPGYRRRGRRRGPCRRRSARGRVLRNAQY